MNSAQRMVVVTIMVSGALLSMYLSFDNSDRLHDREWLGFAVFAAAIGIWAYVWLGRKE